MQIHRAIQSVNIPDKSDLNDEYDDEPSEETILAKDENLLTTATANKAIQEETDEKTGKSSD
jgi:hypothetical protein